MQYLLSRNTMKSAGKLLTAILTSGMKSSMWMAVVLDPLRKAGGWSLTFWQRQGNVACVSEVLSDLETLGRGLRHVLPTGTV